MSHFIKRPKLQELNMLLPFPANIENSSVPKTEPMVVQFNKFDSGALVIGIRICHKIVDWCAIVKFINAWATVSRRETLTELPNFVGAVRFPPGSDSSFDTHLNDGLVTKRFVFDKSTIATFQEKANCGDGRKPSQVLALSAFIWSQFMAAIRTKSGNDIKVWIADHAVNVRQRVSPPLSLLSFGNYWTEALALVAVKEVDIEDMGVLVTRMRDAIKECDKHGVEMWSLNKDKKLMAKNSNEMEFVEFTSWCSFPVYDIDFGFRKPDWVCTPNMPIKNLVILIGTKSGDGIEAWMTTREEDMESIESDPELHPFLS